ncbi:MAG: hypothetical protein LBQ63_00595 [Deltaproteobacteria bacterium]|jgi:hypothetical protein|nr:hypothetical protein [Deltaproteobacteria bacterium]
MGYRSEVGLCLDAAGEKTLAEALQNLETHNEHAGSIRELFASAERKQDEDSGAAAYYWDWLKWYQDYPDVVFAESFLESLENDDYLFIRVGKSDADTEYRGEFWENPLGMCLVRGIAFD